MKWIFGVAFSVLLLSVVSGCTPPSTTPDAIRQDAAHATTSALRDGKAVVQGIFDGLKTKGSVNINRATRADLETLPGIDRATAEKIIANRPYTDSIELRRRHVLSKAEYNRVADRVEAR